MSNNEIATPSPNEFVVLFSGHSLRIYAYIRTLVLDHDDANDVFQNVSCVLWSKYIETPSITNFFAWACQIARYEALAHYRKKGMLGVFSEELLNALSNESFSRSEQLDMRAEALNECLEKLPQRDRKFVEARYQYELRMDEISKSMKLSLASTYRVLKRIHDQLFRCVERTLAQET